MLLFQFFFFRLFASTIICFLLILLLLYRIRVSSQRRHLKSKLVKLPTTPLKTRIYSPPPKSLLPMYLLPIQKQHSAISRLILPLHHSDMYLERILLIYTDIILCEHSMFFKADAAVFKPVFYYFDVEKLS